MCLAAHLFVVIILHVHECFSAVERHVMCIATDLSLIFVCFDRLPTTHNISINPRESKGARGSTVAVWPVVGNNGSAPASTALPPPAPPPGRRRGRAPRRPPDAGIHSGWAVQHERPRRRHQWRLGRRRAAGVRPLAAHPTPLPGAPLGGGPRAAARRHRRGQRARRRARHALRPHRGRRRRQGRRGAGRPAGRRRGARPLRAGRHAHRQLDARHGAVRAHGDARQGRPRRLQRRAGRRAVVPGGDRHHEARGCRALPGPHGGPRPRRPPRPRPTRPPLHPGRDCDCAVQWQVPGAREGSSEGSDADGAKCEVRRRLGAAHCERLHASYHRGSGPARQHAGQVLLGNAVIVFQLNRDAVCACAND